MTLIPLGILFILCASFTGIAQTQVSDLRKQYRTERKFLRVERRNCKRTVRLSRYARKNQRGHIHEYEYNFADTTNFKCPELNMKCGCVGCADNCKPSFEIDEKDGLIVRLKGINPFVYSVDLFVLQGDQISNEPLNEKNLSRELKLEFDLQQDMAMVERLSPPLQFF